MPGLDLDGWVSLASMAANLVVVIWVTSAKSTKLQLGQQELLRQVTAVHKRLDDFAKRLNKAETAHAVLEERVENIRLRDPLRDTSRFRLPEPVREDE